MFLSSYSFNKIPDSSGSGKMTLSANDFTAKTLQPVTKLTIDNRSLFEMYKWPSCKAFENRLPQKIIWHKEIKK